MRESFVFYKSFYDSIKELDPKDQVQIYNAIFEYQFNGKQIELNGVCKSIFTLIIPQLQANNKRYENGKKGGAPVGNSNAKKTTKKQPKNNQKQPNVNVNVNDNVNVNVNVNDNNIYAHFEQFWKAYPKKVSKQKCLKWFEKNKPNEQMLNNMLKQLERFKNTKEWQKENGQFIPYPDTWLRNKRWEDEFETEQESEEAMIKRLEAKYENDNTRN